MLSFISFNTLFIKQHIYRFKATELRLLLLYILPVVLINFPPEIYNHFLLLHCAIRNFWCRNLSRKRSYVERGRGFLKTFVQHCSRLYANNAFNLFYIRNLTFFQHCSRLYGPAFISFNVDPQLISFGGSST